MEDWKQRLHNEYEQLRCRMKKLEAFLTQRAEFLPDIHRGLLRIQLQAMNTYAECLATRIGLPCEPEEEDTKNETPRRASSVDRT